MINRNLTTEQQQQLSDIGTHLQQMRVTRNISLDTVSQQTRISQRLLKAIEGGDAAELPEAFYIQALVRKYAQALDAQDIRFTVESDNSATVANTAHKHRRQYWFNFQLRSLHLYLLYILLVIVSVSGLTTLVERPVVINQASGNNPETPILSAASQKASNTAQTSESKIVPQLVSQSNTPSNTSQTVSVGIDLQERCWLKVMVDGGVAFEGILPEGTQRQWSGKREVTVRAGNAGGVVVSFNNQQQKVLGAPGQVEEVTYTVN